MNIPNTLTIIRLFMVPAFVLFYVMGNYEHWPYGLPIAAILFALAGITDVLDGYIARKYNQITDFGKLADPLADKMMQLAAIGCLSFSGKLSVWVFIVFVVKEIALLLGSARLLAIHKYVVYSKWSGKIATVILFIAIIFIIWMDIPYVWANRLMLVCVVLTLVAFFNYIQIYFKVKENIRQKKEE